MALGANGGSVGFKSVRIYDYAASNEYLAKLSRFGVMPFGADAAASELKAVSASSLSVTLEQSELTAEQALVAVQTSGKTVRVDTLDGNTYKCNVVWDAATLNEDGSYTVTGTVVGVHNPDGLKATATVKLATATVSFTAENATVKVGEEVAESATVIYGGAVSFTVEVAEGYELVVVKLGETELVAVEGVYTIENVTADATVTVETKEEEIVVPPSSDVQTSESVSSGELKSCKSSMAVGGFIALLPLVVAVAALRTKKED